MIDVNALPRFDVDKDGVVYPSGVSSIEEDGPFVTLSFYHGVLADQQPLDDRFITRHF